MKRINRHLIVTGLLASLLLTSCEESLPPHFEDITGIYFNNLLPNRAHTDSLGLTFIYEDKDRIDVPVKVQLLGRTADTDRPVDIRILSGDAREGVDFTAPAAAVLPAGETSFDFIVTLHRTPDLQVKAKQLTVHLSANDHFILPFESIVQSGGQETSVVDFTIEFSDLFTAPPIGWNPMFAGAFSQQKFELITRVMEIPRSHFNDKNRISLAKWMYIQEQMTLYVWEQEKNKEQGLPYDKQAFDENGILLDFQSV